MLERSLAIRRQANLMGFDTPLENAIWPTALGKKNRLFKQSGSGEIDADGAADHVESRHSFER
ncbi:MAG: hypothetical protein JO070_01510 [Verrucomicrobia bacterium]|nr:hypothetical protein [Verrucomicrobiota bacterium]